MKTLTLPGNFYTARTFMMRACLALLCTAALENVSAQGEQATATATNASSTAVSNAATGAGESKNGTLQAKAGSSEALSPAVLDILKMSDAQVSPGVIVAFIQGSRTGYAPTSADLIALKQHNVPDEVTSALMKRGLEVEAQKVSIKRDPVKPTVVKQLSSGSDFDPESYEFWQNHYAYPRALTYSYRTLSPVNLGYSYSYGNGFNGNRSPYGPRRW